MTVTTRPARRRQCPLAATDGGANRPVRAGHRHPRGGFALYLAFLVTSVLFFLVLGGQDVARLTLDLGRSAALEVIGFQAADGGLERGLARLRKGFRPFAWSYVSPLGRFRQVQVEVAARPAREGLDLIATATIFEGGRPVARRRLERQGVQKRPGRTGTGRFLEAS